jgi:hypothetical protein
MENTIYPLDNDLPGDLHGYFWDVYAGALKDATNLNPTPFGGEMISDISDLKAWAEVVCTGKLLEPQTHMSRLQTQPIEGWTSHEEYGEGIVKVGSGSLTPIVPASTKEDHARYVGRQVH